MQLFFRPAFDSSAETQKKPPTESGFKTQNKVSNPSYPHHPMSKQVMLTDMVGYFSSTGRSKPRTRRARSSRSPENNLNCESRKENRIAFQSRPHPGHYKVMQPYECVAPPNVRPRDSVRLTVQFDKPYVNQLSSQVIMFNYTAVNSGHLINSGFVLPML